MPTINGDIVRLTTLGLVNAADAIQNVWHLRVNNISPISDALLLQACDEWTENVYTNLLDTWSNDTTLAAINVQILRDDQALGEYELTNVLNGTETGESTSPQIAVLGFIRTGVSKLIGKKYFGVFSENGISEGLVTGGVLADVANAMIDATTPFIGTGGVSLTGGVWSPTRALFYVATQIAVSGATVVQRRRRVGRGI